MHSNFHRIARLTTLCLGTSALINPVLAAVIDYPNGSNNAAPIVLTDNTTQLQVLTGSATQSGVISETGGSRGLEKIGAGNLFLSSASTYTGGTTISAGTLNILGSISASATTVQSGGRLEGLGHVGAVTVQNGGILAPGNSLVARGFW